MTLLVGADPLARAGLALMLAAEGIELADPVSPGTELTMALEAHVPDVVVWDLGLAGGMADSLRDLIARGVPVLALVADDQAAQQAFDAGVRGVLGRHARPVTIAVALQSVARGLVVLDRDLAESFRRRARPAGPLAEGLTPRELEVLQLLAQGLPNRAIAERLTISDHTAKFHVNAILGKLGAQSRTEGVVRAAKLGLIAL